MHITLALHVHWLMLHILPVLTIAFQDEEDEGVQLSFFQINVGWLFFNVFLFIGVRKKDQGATGFGHGSDSDPDF